MPIIEVHHLTKEYKLGSVTSIKDTLRHGLARLTGKRTWERERFKALDDVTFSIEQGEVVGIIGHNGAGKSTLLKHLAHITSPTSGVVAVRGSVAPLIEVGAGVNPELTGRENIYLNGSILGIPRKVIDEKLDEIIEFSELEQFIDTPVKRYSSGMTVKLGFSIATSMDADILIVDEVLAVGDLAFQRKCFDRMGALIERSGKTVLLVSHNIRQVSRICTRVILLDHGKVLADGSPREVSELFYARSNEQIMGNHKKQQEVHARIESSGEADLIGIEVVSSNGEPTNTVISGGELRVRARFELKQLLEAPEIVVGTHTTDFVYLDSGSTAAIEDRPNLEAGVHEIEYKLDSLPLAPGEYNVRFVLLDKNRRILFSGEALTTFFVVSKANQAYEAAARLLELPSTWKLDGKVYSTSKGGSGVTEESALNG